MRLVIDAPSTYIQGPGAVSYTHLLAFAGGDDGGDELGERGAQGDDGQSDQVLA